jgi:hypothetical protein
VTSPPVVVIFVEFTVVAFTVVDVIVGLVRVVHVAASSQASQRWPVRPSVRLLAVVSGTILPVIRHVLPISMFALDGLSNRLHVTVAVVIRVVAVTVVVSRFVAYTFAMRNVLDPRSRDELVGMMEL